MSDWLAPVALVLSGQAVLAFLIRKLHQIVVRSLDDAKCVGYRAGVAHERMLWQNGSVKPPLEVL